MQQAVDAAQVHECAVVGDVLDHAFHNLAFGEVLHQFRTLFGAGFFHDGAAGHDDVAAALVHLQDLELLGDVHQRRHVAHRTDVHLRARQERNRAAKVDGEAALDAAEDHAVDALIVFERLLETDPGFLAAGLVARQHGFAHRVLDTVEEHFNLVADLEVVVLTGRTEFAQRHAAFGLEAHVDDGEVVLDGNDLALDDAAFSVGFFVEARIEHGREVVAARVKGAGFSHVQTFFRSTNNAWPTEITAGRPALRLLPGG